MSSLEQLQQQLRSLRLSESANYLPSLIKQAESEDWTYQVFLNHLTNYEQKRREEKLIERRLKWASFPFYKTLDDYNLNEQQSISKKQMNQLKEFTWLDQLYNLILLGPPGVGKTHLATGLGIEAIYSGYKVSFISMGELIHTLKTEEFTRKSQTSVKLHIIPSKISLLCSNSSSTFTRLHRNNVLNFLHIIPGGVFL
jgi:DNA replication protein DnaC